MLKSTKMYWKEIFGEKNNRGSDFKTIVVFRVSIYLEMDGSGHCTILRMYLMKCTLKKLRW